MNLFKKIFGTKEEKEEVKIPDFKPDNSRLLSLIAAYHQEESSDNYQAVLDELYSDSAYLVVPTSEKSSTPQSGWTTLKKGETIEFTTVFNVDGLLVFGVFTSEIALSKWIDRETTFMSMPAKVVMELAQEQGFGRIVIDSEQETMFVLERNVTNQKQEIITEDTEILVWSPKFPISGAHQEQFRKAFAKVESIKEVFHFGITKNNEQILILAIVLNTKTENSVLAARASINDGMLGYELNMPLEIMYLDPEDDRFRQFDLFYKSSDSF